MLKPHLFATATLIALTAAAPAIASKGDDDAPGDDRGGSRAARTEVIKTGSCATGGTSKLKLKSDDGRIEVEFEVDRNRAGEPWRVSLSRAGKVTHRASVRTAGRSGSFSFERRISDRSGADRVTARATGPDGATCTATATLG
jgi:hypothetical protein